MHQEDVHIEPRALLDSFDSQMETGEACTIMRSRLCLDVDVQALSPAFKSSLIDACSSAGHDTPGQSVGNHEH